MDKTTLVNEDISQGQKVIDHLDKTDFKVNSALWFYATELNGWRLLIASDYLKKHTLKEAYKFVQQELKKTDIGNISLENISIIGTDDNVIRLLKSVGTTGNNLSMRYSRNVINGVMIEDSYIYRLT
ncbi:hypothetical protein [Methanomethylovorans sp.]|uniref:hypothetical protein n=1 Tax=Methanomethylovorans sp. TaxID=2758717 RepID=UPI00351C566F